MDMWTLDILTRRLKKQGPRHSPRAGPGRRVRYAVHFPRPVDVNVNAKMHRGGPGRRPACFPSPSLLPLHIPSAQESIYSIFSTARARGQQDHKQSNLVDFLPRHTIATTYASAKTKFQLPVCTLPRTLFLKDPRNFLASIISAWRLGRFRPIGAIPGTRTPPQGCSRDLWPSHLS